MSEALRVLIVDEDLDSRVETRRALQRARIGIGGESGFGQSAVTAALENRPDVVLVGVEEPAMRALETADALANALPDTPILLYSSVADADSVRRAMVFGARDYLVKPLQATPLADAIRRALESEERRQMRRAGQLGGDHGRGTVVTVTGAKGGVGKSVLSVNLGLALRLQTGKSVVVFDADTEFGDVATMFDLTAPIGTDELLKAAPTLERAALERFVVVHPTGLHIIAGARDETSWESSDPSTLTRVIELLARTYDFVVIDTSGTFDRFVRGCIDASALTLLVTTGEVSSVRDTAAALERMRRWGVPEDRTRVVLNRAGRVKGVDARDVREAIGRDVFWELPFDKQVPRSVQFGRPVVADGSASGTAAGIIQLARRIAGTSRSLVEPPRPRSRWARAFRFGRRQAVEGSAGQ